MISAIHSCWFCLP